MMTGRDFRDLVVWQRAMDLVESVYHEAQQFPPDEVYGLTSQLRRAVVAIPTRIAEGQGQNSIKEFLDHLACANGALCEVQTQILIAQRLNYLSPPHTERLMELCAEVARLINGLAHSLNKRL
jgi:four helix bundle protein